MRFFIALEVPDKNRQQLQLVQQDLKHLIHQVRLTDTGKLHVTLAFIGEQPNNLQNDLTDLIKQSITGIAPFTITPAYIDGFPNIHHPHTLWVGVKGDIDKLLLIRERIKDQLKDLNLTIDERRFTPHVAIAKLTSLQIDTQLENKLQQLMLKSFDPITISQIKLFESIPSGGFHKHNTLAEIKLV